MNDGAVSKDLEHLKLLSIFHYVLAGFLALAGCFPFIHLSVGVFFLVAPDSAFDSPNGGGEGEEATRMLIGGLFTGIAAMLILAFWALAAAVAMAGKKLAQHRGWTFCIVVAALCCLWMPLGTLLGVFTIIVLMRPSVKELFGAAG